MFLLIFLKLYLSRINKFYSKVKILSYALQIKDLVKEKNKYFLKKLREHLTTINNSFTQLNNTRNFFTNTIPLTNKNKIKLDLNFKKEKLYLV